MRWQAEVFELEHSDRDIDDYYLGVVPWKRVSVAKQFWPAAKKYSYKPYMHASGTKHTGVPTELIEILPGGGGCGGPTEEEPPFEIEIKTLWSEFLMIVEGGGIGSSSGAHLVVLPPVQVRPVRWRHRHHQRLQMERGAVEVKEGAEARVRRSMFITMSQMSTVL